MKEQGSAGGAAQEDGQEEGLALRYIHHGLEISKGEAERLRREAALRVRSERKLLLILDLDHTLLNSSRMMEVPAEGEFPPLGGGGHSAAPRIVGTPARAQSGLC
jgi:RNA polymerase II C-terminal domain phosphatase-like 3/4